MSKARYYTMFWEDKNGEKGWEFYNSLTRVEEKARELIDSGKVELDKINMYRNTESYTLVRNDWSLSPKAYMAGSHYYTLMWEDKSGNKDWAVFKTQSEMNKHLANLKDDGVHPGFILIYSKTMIVSPLSSII